MSEPNIRLPPKWIELNIMKLECATFIASPGDETLCQCGRRRVDHPDYVKHQHRPETWTPTLHTRAFNTDAYGTILFEGEHHPSKAHFVRLSYDTNPEVIVQLMTYVWNLDMPQLLISVRGGSTNFEMPPRLGKIFHAGIVKAARSTNAWVFSNGLNSGAARHLGIALAHEKWREGPRNKRVVSVGMAPWGMIENRNDLLGRNKDRTYSPLDHASSKFLQLNSRHSNFLLVDNGSVGKFGGENYLRRRLEKSIATYPASPRWLQTSLKLDRGCDVPVIVIVVEGGFYTLRQVSDYLNDEPPIPVVIFAGTGRSADLIAWTLRKVHSEEDFDEMKEKIFQKIIHLFQLSNDSHCPVLYQELRNIFMMKNLITIYNPHSTTQEEEFDAVILSSIFRSQHWTPLQQLSLTLVWNRVDIAQGEVFIYGRDWSREYLEHAMMEALVSNRIDFVTLLLEHGLNMQTFLTASRLEALYSLERISSRLLQTLILGLSKLHVKRRKQIEFGNRHSGARSAGRNLTLHDIGIALSHMIGHVYKSSYIHVVVKANKSQGGPAEEQEVMAQTFLQPFDDLFVWAVLTKRHELAKLLWVHGKGALAKALVAVKLNKFMAVELSSQEKTFTNFAVDFENYADEWETLSLSLLDSCYRSNSIIARLQLTMELESWSKQTCLTLAVMANHRTLMGHPCCQQLLADLWMGALSVRSYSTFKIAIGVLFPPFAFFLDYKSTEELKLLPHQGKSSYTLDVFLQAQQDQEANSFVGTRYPNHHHHYKDPHDGKLGTANSASSLMTLLLHRNGRRRSNYHMMNPYEYQTDQQNERKTDLSEVVKHIFPQPDEDPVNSGLAPSPSEPTAHHHHHLPPHNNHFLHVHHTVGVAESIAGVMEETTGTEDVENSRGMSNKPNRHSFVTTQHTLGLWSKFVEFQGAPVTNFYRHTIAYLVFIIALAYVILIPQNDKRPGYTELYVIAYFGTQFLECIREFIVIDALSFSEKLAEIQQNVWQFGDLIVVNICLFGGVMLRFAPGYYEHGMLIYRLSSIYWNARLLKYFGVHRFLGPKIVMMSRMLKHMVHFAMIIVVVIISFGVARQAIRTPHLAPTIKELAGSFLEPYLMMFGEVDMEVFSLRCDDLNHDGQEDCPHGNWIIPIVWVVYMMVANILIVDILIAVYNGIYNEVDSIAIEIWMFQRFHFVMEFEQKPMLPPPFIIICHGFTVLKFIYETFFSFVCEEELLLEAQLDDDIRPHIMMGNDHSLKTYLCPGEQYMVFDFEEENLDNLTPLLDKEHAASGLGGGGASGGTGPNPVPSTTVTADAVTAAFRLGVGNDKFAMQQIKIVVSELRSELEGQKLQVDKLINCLERERELQEENQAAENDYDSRREHSTITNSGTSTQSSSSTSNKASSST